VTLFDATPYCRDYSERISQFLGSSVDGEQCWIDNYVSSSAWSSYTKYPYFYNNVLNIWFEKGMGGSAYGSAEWWRKHRHAQEWYNNSLSEDNLKDFNSGVVAGASWSVVGPGKNLQLASTPHSQTYKFQWYGWNPSGYIDFYDETRHAGRLPEPVTLIGPPDGSFVDANGALFSCEESENATSYELLFGSDPHSLGDYVIISHTPLPPRDVITAFPFRRTWWTIKVWDQFGSSIYADPLCIDADNVVPTVCEVENVSTGNGYNLIQYAIDEAVSGDEIVVKAGVYTENIDFKGKNLSVRSVDPNDSGVVASTILAGSGYTNMVTFANGEDSSCVLAGFTITDARNGIHCSGASPTIVSCRITANVSNGMELHMGSNPVISNCVIADNGHSGVAMLLFQEGRTVLTNSPSVVNCTVVNNSEIGVSGGAARVLNSIISGNRVQILGSSGTVEYSNVQAGYPGAGNIDADPLFADPENGEYHLKSQAGRYDATTQTWIVDSVISPCIDAGDPTSPIGLETSPNAGRINMGAYGGTAEASKSP
ncbi:MAG: right-handed parallel beta-helix repeat-containing protein, partial [Planctomycetes bacterium]|nr:right-handed parallel beta-helix repeat-containing protein [Planctomycetota bacterium]